MIQLITGKKGSGKTKVIIDKINAAVKNTNGCLVCIEKGETLRRSISYKVRWCDAEQFCIDSFDSFYGFIAGMLAGNYDIKEIYVDGILKIAGADFDEFGRMLEKLDKLTGEDASVTFTVSADPSELPTSVTRFID
ncbi:MAG: hypothetical protein ACLUFB_03750 [Ruminococcus sp.]|uniref:hypothetical protein n=1 Tax=Ruminococcus sp. TaxID=41978 RepID=UPI0039939F04